MAIKRKQNKFPKFLIFLVLLGILGFGGYYGWTHWSRIEAIQTVKDFYNDEQGGDYGSAWDLLHDDMKKKFTQADYIKKRTALFIDDFGVKTFSFKIDEVDHLDQWRMTADDSYIKDVYRVTVIQSFVGVFGRVKIYQNVYVTEDKGSWKILWKY